MGQSAAKCTWRVCPGMRDNRLRSAWENRYWYAYVLVCGTMGCEVHLAGNRMPACVCGMSYAYAYAYVLGWEIRLGKRGRNRCPLFPSRYSRVPRRLGCPDSTSTRMPGFHVDSDARIPRGVNGYRRPASDTPRVLALVCATHPTVFPAGCPVLARVAARHCGSYTHSGHGP